MTTAPALALDASAPLEQAARWRLIALLLERPRAGWHTEVTALAAESRDRMLIDAAAAATEAREETYLTILGPGGHVSPREVAYRGMEDPGSLLADIAGFYEAFAYRPHAEDPPDHVAVEAGFVGFLLLKEAYARANGDAAAAEICSQAAGRFLAAHLSALAHPLAQRLDSCESGVLALAAKYCAQLAGSPPAENPALGRNPSHAAAGFELAAGVGCETVCGMSEDEGEFPCGAGPDLPPIG